MLIIITIIFQLILLFPNLVNKYLPADMRIRKNFILFILILIMIFLILVYTLQSKLIFNINSITIVKLVFVIILAILIWKWYLSKIK